MKKVNQHFLEYFFTPIICFLFFQTGMTQQYSIDEFVVITTALNMRELPNRNTEIVITLSQGEVVYPDTSHHQQTIELDSLGEYHGSWMRVKSQGYEGFVFSKYLGTRYMLFYEDDRIGYVPKVQYWYGVYADTINGVEHIRLIQPLVVEANEAEHGHKHNILKTNQSQKSLFIIATNEYIREKQMGLFTRNNRVENKCSEYLRPGDVDALYFHVNKDNITTETYYLHTTGSYQFFPYGVTLTEFDMFLTNKFNPDPQEAIIQNIKQYIGWKEVYILKYFGDIDGDEKPDMIMQGSSNSGAVDILFLSSMAKENELVRPVATVEWYDEC